MSLTDSDRAVLKQLAENGDNAAIPRAVVHFFYAANSEPLHDIANRLEDAGWTDVELGKSSDHFRLLATKVSDLQEEMVERMMLEVEEALSGLDIDYDGWETSVEQSN